MNDLFDDIDNFVEKALEPPKPKKQQVLPTQLAEITRGTWALNLVDLNSGIGVSCEVGYIFDRQDFIALAAVTGQEAAELFETTVEDYENHQRYGRWYSEEHPQGELGTRPLSGLVPIDESEADLTRFVDFKLPVLMMMSDWFKPRLDALMTELEETMLAGMKRISCEKCGNNDVKAVVSYTGTMASGVLQIGEEGDNRLQLSTVINDKPEQITHMHLVCPEASCDWDRCIDIGEFEIFPPGNHSWQEE